MVGSDWSLIVSVSWGVGPLESLLSPVSSSSSTSETAITTDWLAPLLPPLIFPALILLFSPPPFPLIPFPSLSLSSLPLPPLPLSHTHLSQVRLCQKWLQYRHDLSSEACSNSICLFHLCHVLVHCCRSLRSLSLSQPLAPQLRLLEVFTDPSNYPPPHRHTVSTHLCTHLVSNGKTDMIATKSMTTGIWFLILNDVNKDEGSLAKEPGGDSSAVV